MKAKLPSGIVCSMNLLTPPLHSVLRSSILYFTFHLQSIYVYMYYTPDRPTFIVPHGSTPVFTRQNSFNRPKQQRTRRGSFLVARHTTSPHHHHHLTTITTTATTSATATLSLVVPFPIAYRATTPQATPWLEHLSLSLYLSLSPALSPAHTHALSYTSGAEISIYYLPVTRHPYRLNPSKKMWWCSSKMVRWRTKIKKTHHQFVFLGFIIIIIRLNLSVLYFLFYPFRLPIYCREMASWRVGMARWFMDGDEIVNINEWVFLAITYYY